MTISDFGFWISELKKCVSLSHLKVISPSVFCLLFSLILALLAWTPLSGSQGAMEGSRPGLTASLDRDSARVGSKVILTLSYRLPAGAGFSDIPEIKGLEDLTHMDREMGPDEIRLTLLVDQLGSWKTGPISMSYLDKDGKTQVLTTDPVSLTVLSNLGGKPEEAELRPIQGIIPITPLWWKYVLWVAGIAGLLPMVFGLLWWYHKRRRKELSAMAQDPAHVWAKKEIEHLEAQGLFEKGQAKAFYFRFSEIVRRYLEAIRGFPAAEFTTEEITSCIDNEQDRKLLPLLRQADLVKFADTIPTPARKEEEVNTALAYIHETSPGPEAGNSSVGQQRTPT
ncbi:MAG: DUF4381 domain-containing protein [Desulfobacterales bacterium]|nr:DUF4381 domain-containing protein [Desulfobacterales bacterium]